MDKPIGNSTGNVFVGACLHFQGQKQPFTLSLDGSSDQEEQKLVPLTVRVFDSGFGKVVLCSSGTPATYFEKVFSSKSLPWCNCVAFSIASTSVNVRRQFHQN